MGFEPTRAEPIGLAVQRLNHSATSSDRDCNIKKVIRQCMIISLVYVQYIYLHGKDFFLHPKEVKGFPRRELNPGPLGESQIS